MSENLVIARLFVSTREAAGLLGTTEGALRNLRHRRRGPPYHRVDGRSVKYSLLDLKAFAEGERVEPLANS